MNFSEFLKQRRKQKDLTSAKQLYMDLGGQKRLGIALRQFQMVESGKYPPSEKLFAAVFAKTAIADRSELITAYLGSVLADTPVAEEVVEFLKSYLSPGVESTEKNIWESGRKSFSYSEEQLDYLIQNPDAMKLHKRVMLYEKWPESKAGIPFSKVKALENLDLLKIENGQLFPSRTLYRLAHFDNAGPALVAKTTDYVRRQIDAYISREGSDTQELGYAMQLVTPEVAKKVMEQAKAFKRWIQSTASPDTGEHVVPLVYVGFVKKLASREI